MCVLEHMYACVIYSYVCVYVDMSILYICVAIHVEEMISNPLELEIQMLARCRVLGSEFNLCGCPAGCQMLGSESSLCDCPVITAGSFLWFPEQTCMLLGLWISKRFWSCREKKKQQEVNEVKNWKRVCSYKKFSWSIFWWYFMISLKYFGIRYRNKCK